MSTGRMVGHSVNTQVELALIRAVELLSKYAKELNEKDGGNRKTYESVAEWLANGTTG